MEGAWWGSRQMSLYLWASVIVSLPQGCAGDFIFLSVAFPKPLAELGSCPGCQHALMNEPVMFLGNWTSPGDHPLQGCRGLTLEAAEWMAVLLWLPVWGRKQFVLGRWCLRGHVSPEEGSGAQTGGVWKVPWSTYHFSWGLKKVSYQARALYACGKSQINISWANEKCVLQGARQGEGLETSALWPPA